MITELTCRTTLTKLINELASYDGESLYRSTLYELLDIIDLAGITDENSTVEIEVTEQYNTLKAFTIWTDTTIVTTSRWEWSPSEIQNLPYTEAIHVLPVTPYSKKDFEYAEDNEYITHETTKNIDEIVEQIDKEFLEKE